MRIVSIHIPKTGGLTFRNHLEYIYNQKNVIHDYTLCEHPDYVPTPPPSYVIGRLRDHKKTTVVHGHFLMQRYAHIPAVHYICWIRNPIERLLSHYYYWLRSPDYNHPFCLKLVEEGLSIVEFAKLLPDMFTKRLAPIDIDQFDFIGLAERYNESLNLFYNMFCPNIRVKTDIHDNKNLARDTRTYRLNNEQRKELEKINSQDMKLYDKAVKRFELLKSTYLGKF